MEKHDDLEPKEMTQEEYDKWEAEFIRGLESGEAFIKADQETWDMGLPIISSYDDTPEDCLILEYKDGKKVMKKYTWSNGGKECKEEIVKTWY